MKLAINIVLSLVMLVVCVWAVWPDDPGMIARAFRQLEWSAFWPYLAGYGLLLAVTHFCRAWRWNNLLEPIGVRLGGGRLLAISSVGFMAILALPARLGEFVRPALIRQKGKVSAAAALGTVAVERIVDGLLVSIFVFGALFARRGPDAPRWMMPTAYAALGVFSAAAIFLVFALRWPERTVRIAVAMTLAPRFAPKIAAKLEEKLHSMIRGFLVLKDARNFIQFLAWSIAYWGTNGLSLWVLGRGFGLDLPFVAAFAVMGLVAVGITLPNSPGLTGQYQWFAGLGLGLYLPYDVMRSRGEAFTHLLWGLQVIWYIGVGGLALLSRHVSFAEVVESRHVLEEEGAGNV
ncbi:MAG TPA: lysylphosphatidylglycerol synthase transmembrane domain-containing protein [Candidatus Acidoferrum sp.]|nr:lysylphosphatidylglycerol synthase transmembrane domain-containing protein [Candidatus Acidoferrum sp.]